MMKLTSDGVVYTIQGVNPEPWESPEGSVGRRGGALRVDMHSPERLRQYQNAVSEEFERQNPDAINFGKTQLSVEFFLWRNVPEYETPTGRKRTGNEVDATNCQKALEDALQGILYTNDTNNVFVSTWLHQGTDVEPFIVIRLTLGDCMMKEAELLHRSLYVPPTAVIEANRLEGRDIF
jgi:Holliday junction resolvase RusA-like endonuclease